MTLCLLNGEARLSARCSSRSTHRWLRQAGSALLGLLVLALATSCYGSTQPIVKLGLIAPFEEAQRADGYAVLHAVRLAIGERNQGGGTGGYQVALVALNDNGRSDEAAMQAAKLGVDQDVLGVVGPLSATTAAAAAPVFQANDLPWISLASTATGQPSPPAEFEASYRALAGVDPSPQAAQAYLATNRLLDAIGQASRSGWPTRESVRLALAGQG